MVIASDGECKLTAIMRVERDWQTGAPTVMTPEFDEGDASGMHSAMAFALGLRTPAPDQPMLLDTEAAEIAGECVAAVDATIELVIANPNRDDIPESKFFLAVTPQQPATVKVLEWLVAAGRELKGIEKEPGVDCILLLATTIHSLADVLRDQGFDGEVRQMMDALERSDAAARPS